MVPGRHVEVPGYEGSQSHVVALAVSRKGTPRWKAWGSRFFGALEVNLWGPGESPQERDEGATRSRLLASYAAGNVLGEGARWDQWTRDHVTGNYVRSVFADVVASLTVELAPCSGDTPDTVACLVEPVLVREEATPVGVSPAAGKTVTLIRLRKVVRRAFVRPGEWRPLPLSGDGVPSESMLSWVGGSAGLAYALAYLDRSVGGVLVPAGLTVAATGGLDATPFKETRVTRVDGVPQKLQGAALAGADVVFVPVGSDVSGSPLPVVEVGTVEDAVAWLCGRGSRASVCDGGRGVLSSAGADTGH